MTQPEIRMFLQIDALVQSLKHPAGENLRWMSLSGFSALEGRKLAGAAQEADNTTYTTGI